MNKEKAEAYLAEYATNGFNKTQAHIKVNPKAAYHSNKSHTNRIHNKSMDMVTNGDLSVDIEQLLAKSKQVLKQFFNSKKVKLANKANIAVQLTKREVADKQENTNPDKLVIVYQKEGKPQDVGAR